MTNLPLLSILTFLPLIGLPFIIIGKLINSENYEIISKYIALFVSLIAFIISLIILYNFDISTSNFQFNEHIPIMNGLMTYRMGIDGISILFIFSLHFLHLYA